MDFTNRFIKLPIRVFDKRQEELIGKSSDEESWMKVNPMEIASYRPSWDQDDETKSEVVCLKLKSGDTTLIYMTVNEFEALLNNHYCYSNQS